MVRWAHAHNIANQEGSMRCKTKMKAGLLQLSTTLRAHDEQEDVGKDELY